MDRDRIDALRAYLYRTDAIDRSLLLPLLQEIWDELDGSDALENYKLSRIADVRWTDPVLSFIIERHGGTVLGSSRAELQHWTVDLDAGTARADTRGFRQLRPMRRRFDAAAAASEIAVSIAEGRDDPRVEWSADRRTVRLTAQAINPEGGSIANQTAQGRRKRLRDALLTELPTLGWNEYAPGRWRET